LVGQSLLLRDFLWVQQGYESSIAVFFATWLFWVGVGATLVRQRSPASAAPQHPARLRLLLALGCCYPLLAWAQSLGFVSFRSIVGLAWWEHVSLSQTVVWGALLNAPFSLATGMLFALLSASLGERAREWEAAGLGLARKASWSALSVLYGFETLGAGVGGGVMTLGLQLGLAPLTLLAGFSGLMALAVVAVAVTFGRSLASLCASLVFALSAALALGPSGAALGEVWEAWRWRQTLGQAQFLESIQTPYSQVQVGLYDGVPVAFSAGRSLVTAEQSEDGEFLAALMLAEHPRARRVMLLAPHRLDALAALLRSPLEELVLVVQDERLHHALLRHWPAEVQRAMQDPRLRLCVSDPILVAQRCAARQGFDVVYLESDEALTLQAYRLHTQEFFVSLRSLLSDEAVLISTIRAGENLLSGPLLEAARADLATLRSVFTEVLVGPGEHAFVIASNTQGLGSVDAELLAERHRARVESDRSSSIIPAEHFAIYFPPSRLAWRAADLGELESVPNTIEDPRALARAIAVQLEEDGIGEVERLYERASFAWLLFPWGLLLIALFLMRRPRCVVAGGARETQLSALLSVAGVGAVSMASSVLLLYAYQSRFGNIYLMLGALSALFMVGNALGVWLGKHGASLLPTHCWPRLLPLALSMLLLPWLFGRLDALQTAAEPLFALLFAWVGVASGLAVGKVSELLWRARGPAAAKQLVLLDHWGGALGAAMVGLLALPTLGLSQTSLFLACILIGVMGFDAAMHLGSRRSQARERADTIHDWRRQGAPRSGASSVEHPSERAQEPSAPSFGSLRGLLWALAGLGFALLYYGAPLRSGVELGRAGLSSSVELLQANPAQLWTTRGQVLEAVPVEQPFPHVFLRFEQGPAMLQVDSRRLGVEAQGYGGALSVIVLLNAPGSQPGKLDASKLSIAELRLAEHHETPSYLLELEGFFARFSGHPLSEALELEELGVVTGATVSANAITHAAEELRGRVLASLQAQTPTPSPPAESPLWPQRWGMLLTLLGFVAFLFASLARFQSWAWHAPLRLGLLALALLFNGILWNQQLALFPVLQFAETLPSLQLGWLLALVLGWALLFGAGYCGYACPAGAAQELLFLSARWLRRRWSAMMNPAEALSTEESHPDHLQAWSWMRWVLLLSLVFAYALGAQGWVTREPLHWLFAPTWPSWLAVLALLLAGLRHQRFWCRALCPLGALLSLSNRLALLSLGLRPKHYRRCELGVSLTTSSACIQCQRCNFEGLGGSPEAPRPSPASALTEGGAWSLLRHRVVAGALVLAVLVLLFWPEREPQQEAPSQANSGSALPEGTSGREVDATVIQEGFERGLLSDREALFYRAVEAEER
ncbi:MAG: 4Fe-4S binding protein, partial [Myxococcota bacterium]|nr:4Fe-4S binding protein [Myxococcota bacterium]